MASVALHCLSFYKSAPRNHAALIFCHVLTRVLSLAFIRKPLVCLMLPAASIPTQRTAPQLQIISLVLLCESVGDIFQFSQVSTSINNMLLGSTSVFMLRSHQATQKAQTQNVPVDLPSVSVSQCIGRKK